MLSYIYIICANTYICKCTTLLVFYEELRWFLYVELKFVDDLARMPLFR